ncbi:MAG: response regulator [bacterium]|nr:response regulator [Gammaproteobacteria bacterium]HIL94884.1 response regulator [Pseudomonadales bacterium]
MKCSTVLVVDDEQKIRSALRRTLEPEGYNVLEAGNVKEALNVLERGAVKLVISDMRMPGINGTELLKEMVEHHGRIRRIVLTGYGDLPGTIVAINEGCVHRYLTKPWDNDELRRIVAEELDLEKNERDWGDRVQTLRSNVSELNKKLDTTANLLRFTTDMLQHSRYHPLVQLHETLTQYQTPLKVELNSRVQLLTERIAVDLKLDNKAREVLNLATMLHRLGEFALPIDLINKCSRDMTDHELQLYKTYPAISASFVDSTDCELMGILSSHRRYLNGSGIFSSDTDEIPLASRILCASTEYEEMKLLKSHELGMGAIREIMLAGAGELYDEKVIAALVGV